MTLQNRQIKDFTLAKEDAGNKIICTTNYAEVHSRRTPAVKLWQWDAMGGHNQEWYWPTWGEAFKAEWTGLLCPELFAFTKGGRL